MRRVLASLPHLALAPPLVLALSLMTATGCGTPGPDAAVEVEDRTMVEITIEGGRADPVGDRVEIGTGESVELVVMADSEGEIHVHSDPEEEYTYEPGTTTFALEVDRPGIVDVELHDPHQLILQLEVR